MTVGDLVHEDDILPPRNLGNNLLHNLGSKLLHYFSYSSPYISGSGSISMTLPFSITTTPVLY